MTGRNWTSSSWYRVSAYRPRLRSHARIHRHLYRGKIWFVLQDRVSGRFHRFTPEAYRLIAMMDGARTLDDIWQLAVGQFDIDAVTQDELVRLVGQLYSADVLAGDVPPDIMEMSERGRRAARQQIVRSVLNPLALRLPLFDPDDFLTATMPMVRPLFSWFGWSVFFGVLAYGLVLAATHWGPLTENVTDRVLSGENLVLLLVAYPLIKALHELGHAYAIKRWGGSVNEIGVMFLVLMPVPYVNASDSIAFSSKWRRALVGGAGILVELFCAAIAMIVWAGAEEGLVRAFAFNVMLIGGVSTLFFNGNPLLRFDGYYVLCDIAEIPNLAQRANRYLGYLVQRYGFGMPWVENPVTARGEAPWLFVYAIAAYLYRLFITAAIVSLVATRFFVVGLLLAIWAVFLMIVLPMLKGVWFLLTSPVLRRHRGRAFAVTGTVLALVLGVLLAWPVPHNTLAQGIVLPEADAYANAGAEGEIVALHVVPGQQVRAGDPLLSIEDPLIRARRGVLVAQLAEIERRLAAARPSEQTTLRIFEDELAAMRADLALTDERIAQQILRAPVDGQVILPVASDLVGRHVRRGDLLAMVVPFQDPLLRVVVQADAVELVRGRTLGLEVRFARDPGVAHPARVLRAAPALSRTLPSLALATEGGGRITLDPSQPRERLQAIEGVYQIDLALEGAFPVAVYGDRVHVRFAHGEAPLADRLYRAAARVFLKYFVTRETVA
ncbi:biotin/lipoyl-binding protein [Roseovarius autotrophicus]|uniref:biotin/lipoyl-binding protein n=1 Tax=Roseovarius autotrophicus TaxID=2824121 RepID=UPI0019DE03F8|nr:biotin/lipoyl-binding protein [Roseovarius autotrophicus]MBE0452528.1 peptidase M50 [Roseovarius sp.]